MTKRLPENFPIAFSLLLIVLVFVSISLGRLKKAESVTSPVINDTFFFDLESESSLENLNTLKPGSAFSGKVSCHLDENNEYSVTFSKALTDLPEHKKYSEVNFSFSIFAPEPISGAEVIYSLNNEDNNTTDYQSRGLKSAAGIWQKMNFSFPLNDEFRNGNGKMKLYVWNKQKEKLMIDDLLIHFK